MLHNFLSKLDSKLNFETASAHCDIPCKIYDPATAQIAALTVIRLLDLIQELSAKNDALEAQNTTQATQIADLITRVTALEAE